MRTIFAWAVLALPLTGIAATVVPVAAVKTYVNIRQAPDAGSDILGRLPKGSSMPLVEATPGWNMVQLDNGQSGYISADWTTIVVDEVADSAAIIADVRSVDEPQPATEEELAPVAVTEPVAESELVAQEQAEPVAVAVPAAADVHPARGPQGPPGPPGPAGPPGPPGEAGAGSIAGKAGYLVRFKKETVGESSQIYDDGNQVGIGTTEPKQRLEVNGSIQIHERNSAVAGLMITQSSGETGYIMHNRASTLTIGSGSVDRMTIDHDGNVGIGTSRPAHPMEMASGAHVTAGGVWTNSSSRHKKENIRDLSDAEALATLAALQPVHFTYKSDADESYVGFIAEDVPEIVATSDRDGLSAMDIVAVLTKVIQVQQQRIDELESRLTSHE